MSRRKKLTNNTDILQHQIEAIARCIMPDILAFYESAESQREICRVESTKEYPTAETRKRIVPIQLRFPGK